jgi:ankyrin repeat protein
MRVSGVIVVVAAVLLAHAIVLCAGEIHEAVIEGNVERVKQLLKADPSLINVPDENDRFNSLPLHHAATHGNIEIARILLKAGADIECGDSDESTPLDNAGVSRQGDMVRFLLEQGADVNRRDKNGACALSFAASAGDSAIVDQLLAAGADLNYLSPQGLTLMHYAASRDLVKLFGLLTERGDDVNATTTDGLTPMHLAAYRARPSLVKRMIELGADPSPKNSGGETPLMRAAWRNSVDFARILLEAGVGPDSVNNFGGSALEAATWAGNSDFVNLLLEHGANANIANDRGETPLASAVERGDPDIVAALLDAGADPDVTEERYNWTPLHMAAIQGYPDITGSLLTAGASPNLRDNDGSTALDLASRYGHGRVAELLVEKGAEGNGKTTKGTLAAQGELGQGEAVIWYLGHSGWGIKTREHFLVFDWNDRWPEPAEPGLCNGHIVPSELAAENVAVFASHEHGDHLDPRIFDWNGQIPNITYVIGCEADSAPPYELMEGRQVRTIDGMKVTTIESNDTGVAFVVEVDGMVIYHAGDHANRLRDFSGPYTGEIDYLASRGVKPDIAFMPISGCGFGDQEAVKMGVHYALEAFEPKVFVPMHAGLSTYRYFEFIDDCKDRFPRVQMYAPKCRGDYFRYRDGRIS